MDLNEVKRINVYTQFLSEDRQEYFLEVWDGKNWEVMTDQNNISNFDSLDSVAQRIVQICPSDNLYKRVIFSDKSLDNREGRLEGICLNDGNPYLVDSLIRDEKILLLRKIQEYSKQISS